MRYMHWSWVDLMTCPVDLLDVIAEVAREDAAAAREATRRPSRRR